MGNGFLLYVGVPCSLSIYLVFRCFHHADPNKGKDYCSPIAMITETTAYIWQPGFFKKKTSYFEVSHTLCIEWWISVLHLLLKYAPFSGISLSKLHCAYVLYHIGGTHISFCKKSIATSYKYKTPVQNPLCSFLWRALQINKKLSSFLSNQSSKSIRAIEVKLYISDLQVNSSHAICTWSLIV